MIISDVVSVKHLVQGHGASIYLKVCPKSKKVTLRTGNHHTGFRFVNSDIDLTESVLELMLEAVRQARKEHSMPAHKCKGIAPSIPGSKFIMPESLRIPHTPSTNCVRFVIDNNWDTEEGWHTAFGAAERKYFDWAGEKLNKGFDAGDIPAPCMWLTKATSQKLLGYDNPLISGIVADHEIKDLLAERRLVADTRGTARLALTIARVAGINIKFLKSITADTDMLGA